MGRTRSRGHQGEYRSYFKCNRSHWRVLHGNQENDTVFCHSPGKKQWGLRLGNSRNGEKGAMLLIDRLLIHGLNIGRGLIKQS